MEYDPKAFFITEIGEIDETKRNEDASVLFMRLDLHVGGKDKPQVGVPWRMLQSRFRKFHIYGAIFDEREEKNQDHITVIGFDKIHMLIKFVFFWFNFAVLQNCKF